MRISDRSRAPDEGGAGKNGLGFLAVIVLATAVIWGVAACLLALPVTLDHGVLLR